MGKVVSKEIDQLVKEMLSTARKVGKINIKRLGRDRKRNDEMTDSRKCSQATCNVQSKDSEVESRGIE